MKQQDITYQEYWNTLMMDIQNPISKSKIFVLVEGDSDIKFFNKFINTDNCVLSVVRGGKFKVIECVKDFQVRHKLLIGIVDADFMHLNNEKLEVGNVFLTDYHDIEMVIISNLESFSTVLSEHTHLSKELHIDVRNKILSILEDIAYLKLLNQRDNLEYNFDTNFIDLIDFQNNEIDLEKYFYRIIKKSLKPKSQDFEFVSNELRKLKDLNHDKYHLCNGHDFINLFFEYLKTEHKSGNVNRVSLASNLRVAFTPLHYQQTKLYADTQNWATNKNVVIYSN